MTQRVRIARQRRIACAAGLLLLGIWAGHLTAGEGRPQILMLHSYHKADWTDELIRGYSSVLDRRPPCDVHIEYMDTKRNQSPAYFEQLTALYRTRYGATQFAVVLTSDDNAFHFALDRQETLFRGAPVVFCGVNRFEPEMLRDHPNVTGVVEKGDFKETLALAFRLFPRARTVRAITDNTETAQINLAGLEAVLREDHPQIRMEKLEEGLSLDELGQRLRRDPKEAIGFFIAFWKDQKGQPITPQALGEVLKQSATPVFGRSEWMIGRGQLGGKCVTGFHQGAAAAELAARILDGTPAAQIPVVLDSPNKFLFDYAELAKFGVALGDLPPGSIVANRPSSIYREYQNVVWSAVAVFLLLGTLIVLLARNIVRRRRIEAQLRSEQAKLTAIFDQTFQLMGLLDKSGRVLSANRAALAMVGVTEKDVIGRALWETPWWTHSEELATTVREAVRKAVEGQASRFAATHPGADGRLYDIDFSLKPLVDASGAIQYLIAEGRDITEYRALEERLRQSQKLEAIGQLAGGIAHDFNNQLTAIVGYGELLTAGVSDGRLRGYAEGVVESARKSASLTRQLLAFARKGRYESVEVDLHALIDEVVSILERSIDKRIRIQRVFNARAALVMGDPGLLQNALLNLALNARDAMPDGGQVTFETSDRASGRDGDVPPELRPGPYLCLKVRDTGAGIAPEMRDRIFEPFFTTKSAGKGTGLGLAAVYGTVQRHGGALNVESQVGQGCCFTIFLPVVAPSAPAARPSPDSARDFRHGRVLLIDDERFVRELTRIVLEDMGHVVVVRENGRLGVDYYREHWREIDLVVMDLIMPEMDGRTALGLMREINPEVRVLLISGYSSDAERYEIAEMSNFSFLQKPYERRDLIEKVVRLMAEG